MVEFIDVVSVGREGGDWTFECHISFYTGEEWWDFGWEDNLKFLGSCSFGLQFHHCSIVSICNSQT